MKKKNLQTLKELMDLTEYQQFLLSQKQQPTDIYISPNERTHGLTKFSQKHQI